MLRLKIRLRLSEIKTNLGILSLVFILSESGSPSHVAKTGEIAVGCRRRAARPRNSRAGAVAFPPLENFKKRIKTWSFWKTDHRLFGGGGASGSVPAPS